MHFPSLSALLLAHFTTRGGRAARAATPPRSSPMTMTSWPARAGLRAAVPTAPPTEGTSGTSRTTPRGGETTRPRPAPKKVTCPPCRRMRAVAQAKGCASPTVSWPPCMGPTVLGETELEMGCLLQIPGAPTSAPPTASASETRVITCRSSPARTPETTGCARSVSEFSCLGRVFVSAIRCRDRGPARNVFHTVGEKAWVDNGL